MEEKKYSINDPEAIAHINMLQGIINRMAANSANCKNWAVTLVIAVFALSDTDGWQRFFICLGATIMFFLLDCFYLGLERRFIGLQNAFVRQLYGEPEEKPKSKPFKFIKPKKNQSEETDNLEQPLTKAKPFKINKSTCKEKIIGMFKGMISMSTTPFYLMLVGLSFIFVCVKGNDSQDLLNSENSDGLNKVIVSSLYMDKSDIWAPLSNVHPK